MVLDSRGYYIKEDGTKIIPDCHVCKNYPEGKDRRHKPCCNCIEWRLFEPIPSTDASASPQGSQIVEGE